MAPQQKYLCISCEVLARPVYLCAARSPHVIDVELVEMGLHTVPAELRAGLQERIDAAEGKGYDALLLGYGLCGQATAGLSARSTPLVVPRAHDCITLFLGSRQRYQEQFESYPGTYWYAQDYFERGKASGPALSLGSGSDVELEGVYQEYLQKYGKNNADYLMEVMGAWANHYRRAVYMDLGFAGGEASEAHAQNEATRRGWVFERLAGDLVLIRRLLNGDWEDEFLTVPPGQQLVMTYNEDVIGCIVTVV